MKKINTPYKKGNRFTTKCGLDLKIMSIADNWIMCRYIGCKPFTVHLVRFRYFLKTMGANPISTK